MKVDAKELVLLLELANEMRKKKGDDLLEDLPVSDPWKMESCLIANAFNYGCQVNPGEGLIFFQTLDDMEMYFKVLKEMDLLDPSDDYLCDFHGIPQGSDWKKYLSTSMEGYVSPLPMILVDIAENFDRGAYKPYASFDVEAVVAKREAENQRRLAESSHCQS